MIRPIPADRLPQIRGDECKGRLKLSDAERATLGEIGHRLGRKVLGEVANVARPDTDTVTADAVIAPTAFWPIRVGLKGAYPESPILIERQNSENTRPMVSVMGKERTQESPATLGDVLYARSKAPAPEQDWATLVQSIAAGDQLALHALYERAHRPVFTLMMRITANRETAEELTVDVFHDVWRRATRYDAASGTVLGWIINQARSRALDRLRFESRKKRRHGGDEHPLAEVAADPRDVLELREQSESLRAALATLTPDERQAIETTFFAGLTHAEAAARLNQPLGTIKTRIRSGLHKLRHALTEEAVKP